MNRQQVAAAARRHLVGEKFVAGWTQRQMAEHFGVTQQQISRDLHLLQKEWQAANVTSLDHKKAEQNARIHWGFREMLAAWEASKQVDGEAPPLKGRTRGQAASRAGNPAFMERFQHFMDQHAKLWGYNAVQRVPVDLSTCTTEQLVQLAQGVPPEQVLHQPTPPAPRRPQAEPPAAPPVAEA